MASNTGDIVFQALNWWSGDERYNDDNDDDDDESERFLIKTWGIDPNGQSVSVTIKGFPPYFYVKIPYDVTKLIEAKYRDWLTARLSRRFRGGLQGVRCLRKKDFYGFKNNQTWNFLRFSFNSLAAFRMSIRIFQNPVKIPGIQQPEQKYKLYESNIEPAIRMLHHQNIQPCGWIKIPKGYWSQNNDLLPTRSNRDIECHWKRLYKMDDEIGEKIAPMTIASFDIECNSSHGDFPQAQKSYQKLSNEIFAYYQQHIKDLDLKEQLFREMFLTFQSDQEGQLSKVFTKKHVNLAAIQTRLIESIDDIYNIVQGKIHFLKNTNGNNKNEITKKQNQEILRVLTEKLGYYDDEGEWSGLFPMLLGDEIIQIGITCHKYGERKVSSRYIISAGTCDPIPDVEVIISSDEKNLLLDFTDLLTRLDPDIVTGYNILGFDLAYMYGRSRELGITHQFCRIGRIVGRESPYVTKNLSSSALGDNLLRYIDMEGRTIIDVMKVVQRDHKLDSYKLDSVAKHFMNLNKKDVTPNQIFSLFRGSSFDRKIIADYCVQDCALCNQLIIKLEILANNIGMANVCHVPLAYIFLRGQGIKIFSLVAKQCREDEFVVPSLARPWGAPIPEEEDDGYEGAIVLEPETGIYVEDPISVLDFASLYPSSMISENLSHDCHLLDEDNGKYDNLPGMEYIDITYDVFKSKKSKKSQNEKKIKIGEETRRFAQTTEGVLPRILKKLLGARKLTRKKILYRTITCLDGTEHRGLAKYHENNDIITMVDVGSNASWQIDRSRVDSDVETYDEFQKAVLDGLQLAYKVTANSLYGQTGSKVSPIYMKEVAACTTATGRNMILMAKRHVEEVYGAHVIYGDSVTGDTPLLIKYPDNTIDIKTIDTLTDKWVPYDNFKPFDSDLSSKEQGYIDAQVWTDGEWTDIKRVIRHETSKKIYRVNTFGGCVDVTEDHSLIDINGDEIKPGDCVVGDTELRHSFPEEYDYDSVQISDQGEKYVDFIGVDKKCDMCEVTQDESEYYWGTHVGKKTGEKRRVNRCRTCIKSVNALLRKTVSGPVNDKILKYYVPAYEINKFEAWVWGIFFGDGSCGYYHCESGNKRSWAINNSNMHYLEIAKKYLENIEPRSVVSNFKILDTIDSSKVYKLVPVGSIKYMVEKYRHYLYDREDYKRVPDVILNADYETRLWFMRGYLAADGTKGLQKEMISRDGRHNYVGIANGKWDFACKGKIGAQGLYYLCISLGWKNIRVNNRDDKENTYNISNVTDRYTTKQVNKVFKIISLPNEYDYVYDVETSYGRFNAGVGSINIFNTDSIFVKFATRDENGNLLRGRDALSRCRELGVRASETIKPLLKKPHDLEWEKMFWPFVLLSKKRYCANKYEFDDTRYKMNSMGIVLKRRDNANIVKKVYGEVLDIILNRQDVTASIKFLKKSLNDIVLGKFPLEEFIISKTLKSTYSDPDRIAHKVLADKMQSRDPGNAPQVNDRLPYAYVVVPEKVKKNGLQGDRIEHPDYIREKKLQIDFQHYLENQIMNPVLQIYALILENLDGYKFKPDHFVKLERHLRETKRAELQKHPEKVAGISKDEIEKIIMEKVRKKIASVKEQEVKKIIFDPILYRLQNKKNKMTEITDFFR